MATSYTYHPIAKGKYIKERWSSISGDRNGVYFQMRPANKISSDNFRHYLYLSNKHIKYNRSVALLKRYRNLAAYVSSTVKKFNQFREIVIKTESALAEADSRNLFKIIKECEVKVFESSKDYRYYFDHCMKSDSHVYNGPLLRRKENGNIDNTFRILSYTTPRGLAGVYLRVNGKTKQMGFSPERYGGEVANEFAKRIALIVTTADELIEDKQELAIKWLRFSEEKLAIERRKTDTDMIPYDVAALIDNFEIELGLAKKGDGVPEIEEEKKPDPKPAPKVGGKGFRKVIPRKSIELPEGASWLINGVTVFRYLNITPIRKDVYASLVLDYKELDVNVLEKCITMLNNTFTFVKKNEKWLGDEFVGQLAGFQKKLRDHHENYVLPKERETMSAELLVEIVTFCKYFLDKTKPEVEKPPAGVELNPLAEMVEKYRLRDLPCRYEVIAGNGLDSHKTVTLTTELFFTKSGIMNKLRFSIHLVDVGEKFFGKVVHEMAQSFHYGKTREYKNGPAFVNATGVLRHTIDRISKNQERPLEVRQLAIRAEIHEYCKRWSPLTKNVPLNEGENIDTVMQQVAAKQANVSSGLAGAINSSIKSDSHTTIMRQTTPAETSLPKESTSDAVPTMPEADVTNAKVVELTPPPSNVEAQQQFLEDGTIQWVVSCKIDQIHRIIAFAEKYFGDGTDLLARMTAGVMAESKDQTKAIDLLIKHKNDLSNLDVNPQTRCMYFKGILSDIM